jgi:Tfp pilus assembly protein FimT
MDKKTLKEMLIWVAIAAIIVVVLHLMFPTL